MASSIRIISVMLFFMLMWTVGCVSYVQWARLTQRNFTSEIHKHSFVVTIATVPWCGESRSIMKELLKSIEADQDLYAVVQLRVIYVNLDKDLGLTVIGRNKIPRLTFYLHATLFQYNGALKVQNILAAMHRGLTISSGNFPFRMLESTSDVEKFLKSTEIAVVLYDICNYAEKLGERNWHKWVKKGMENPKEFYQDLSFSLLKKQRNEYCNNMGKDEVLQPNIHEIQLQHSYSSREGDVSQDEDILRYSLNSKFSVADENDIVISRKPPVTFISGNRLDSNIDFLDNGSSKISEADVDEEVISRTCGTSLPEDILENSSDRFEQSLKFEISTSCSYPLLDSQLSASLLTNINHANQLTRHSFDRIRGCNQTDYKHYAMLYQNLSRIARVHVLTPDYVDFGIIRDKSLVLDLGMDKMQNFTWFLMVQTMGQPDAPKIYFETETMDSFISDSMQLVPELNRESAKHYSSLMEGKPSVVLFIDRTSPSLQVREKSWDALRAVFSVAAEYQKPKNPEGTDIIHSDAEELQANKIVLKSVDGNELLNAIAKLKESLNYGTLTDNVLQPSAHQADVIEDNASDREQNLHQEADRHDTTIVLKVLLDNAKLQLKASLLKMSSEKIKALGIKDVLVSESNAVSGKAQNERHVGELDLDYIPSSLVDIGSVFSLSSSGQRMKMSSAIDRDEERVSENLANLSSLHSLSYFRVDGDDSMKDMLLQNVPYPSLVILDPSEGGHFVFPIDQSISYSSVKEFIYEFSRGSLKRVYNSGPEPQSPRKRVKPPFVNRDFHVMNGVPQITVETLSKMLVNSQAIENASDLSKRGILVHFTLSACGFCKRMELIFREIHQLLMLHVGAHLEDRGMGQNGNEKQPDCVIGAWNQFQDKVSYAHDCWCELKDKLPVLFQIDCTMNDCSLFFKDLEQEGYPSIILFSPKRKAKIIFNGGPSVQQALEFIFRESNIDMRILHMLQGTIRLNEELKSQTSSSTSLSSQPVWIDSCTERAHHLYNLKANTAKETPSFKSLESQGDNIAVNNHDSTNLMYPEVGSVLVATKKLNANASKLFENSRIWIVKADGQEGFQGLILNKPLPSWKLLRKLVGSVVEEIFNNTVLSYGGPVLVNGQPFVSLTRLKGVEGYLEVVPGIYFGDTLATMQVLQSVKEVNKLDISDFWFFLGHSAWSWQQLLDEVEENLWQLSSYGKNSLSGTIQEWQNGSKLDISDLAAGSTRTDS